MLRLDPVRAEQVLDNLVTNAVKHGGRDDLRVQVTSRLTADAVELRVTDDGRGVATEDAERIFGLFQRGRSAGAAGSGVGLGMVRRIVEHYGGEVGLEPRERGAAFVVSLPRHLLAAPPERRGADAAVDVEVRPATAAQQLALVRPPDPTPEPGPCRPTNATGPS